MTEQMVGFTDDGDGPVYVISAELFERILTHLRETQAEVTLVTFSGGTVDVKGMCRECFDKMAYQAPLETTE